MHKAVHRNEFPGAGLPRKKQKLLGDSGSKEYFQVAMMAFLCFLMWTRQANSSIAVSFGYPIFLSHQIFASSIVVALILYGRNALKMVQTTRTLRRLFFLLFVFVAWLYLSNNLADLALAQSNNWGTFNIQYYDWLISLTIIFISIGVIDNVISHGQGKLFLLLLLIFCSITSVLLFYLYIFSIAEVLSGGAESQDLFSGGNRMIVGKIFFVNMLLMTACFRYRINRNAMYKAGLILGHLTLATFIVAVSVRTALLSWAVLVFLVMLVDSRKNSVRWFVLKSTVVMGASLFVVLTGFSLLLAGMVSLGYSPNIFFDIASSPLKVLDDILSGRYASALFGVSFFMKSMDANIYHAVIGFGNEWSSFLFKSYYAQMISLTVPTIDLSYFQQGDHYSPHNSFVDILISNGLIGFVLFAWIIIFILLSMKNMINNSDCHLLQKYFRSAIVVVIVGFFCTDVDFVGGRIILNIFFILFITAVLVYKHTVSTHISSKELA